MDDRRFDELARSFAGLASRRSVLKTLTGSALAAAGAVIGVGSAAAACRNGGEICRKNGECCSNVCGPKDATGRQRCVCPEGTTQCGSACKAPAEFTGDVQNCGACGNVCQTSACAPATCVNGVCGTAPIQCGPNSTCNGGTCVCDGGPTATCPNGSCCAVGQTCNSENVCGGSQDLGTECGSSGQCASGFCCPEGTTREGLCGIDTGGACPGGSNNACCSGTCVNGTCIPEPNEPGEPCDPGDEADCEGDNVVCCVNDSSPTGFACTDVSTDPNNCGDCAAQGAEHICGANEVCETGTCNTLGPDPICRGEDACIGSVGCGESGLGCSCGTLVDGGGICRETIGDCSNPTGCNSDADCDNGRVCANADNCCPQGGFAGVCTTPCGEMAEGGQCTVDGNCAGDMICCSGVCTVGTSCCSTTTCAANSDCCSGACICGGGATGTCQASFFQGFETDATGWTSTTRVASGTDSITSATGAFHGKSTSGAFTQWGGYTNVFPTGGYSTSVSVFLDMTPGVANDTRFDWTSAITGATGCAHRRDFAFNAGFYNDTDVTGTGARYVISASTNTGRANSFPKNPGRSPYAITTEGWYTFTHQFQDVAGVLQVTLTVSGPGGSNSWILSDPSDTIPANVGGNRYGWFPSIELPFLAIDDSSRA